MQEAGCTPWRMSATDYTAAVALAESLGVDLERDADGCGPTPWDPELRTTFDRVRLIVHEELVLEHLLDGLTGS